jgi:3-hydroxyisobutyrate dehydrogenase-like beta-hydroxyacid dehydrogenase
MTKPTKVGVVGLGKMGNPIARHLCNKGNEVLVFDVNRDAIDSMTAAGCLPAYHLSDLHDQCDFVFIVVSFDHQVEAICQGEDGFFTNSEKPVTLVVCSTIEPETMTRLAEAAPAHVYLVDAPLCRGEIPAEKGELLGLMGGDEEDCEAVKPFLSTFCSDVEYIGPLGSGQVAKALNNFILWSCISVNHEAFKLGKRYGLDQETLRQALLKSSGQNWAMKTWNQPRTMPWAEKDMRIILNMADSHNLPLTMAGFIKEHIKLVKDEWGLYDKV